MDNNHIIVMAVKGIIEQSGKTLIIKRSAYDETGAGIWEFTGGKINFGEELETALIREAYEETGLNIKIEKILYATTFKTSPYRQVVVITYKCTLEDGISEVRLSEEHTDYKWADTTTMKKYLDKNILKDLEQNNII